MEILFLFKSDNSKKDTDPKKAKEAISNSSYSDHDVFEGDLDSSNCRSFLFHCLRNLESKVNEIFANANTFKVDQIKGEKQLTDFAETVNFLSEKIHEFEANTKLKEEIIKSLRGQVSVLHDDLKKNADTSGPAGTMFLLELSSFLCDKRRKR